MLQFSALRLSIVSAVENLLGWNQDLLFLGGLSSNVLVLEIVTQF